MTTRRRSLVLLVAFVAAFVCLAAANASPKNVIFFITDGTGPEAIPLARWVKGSALNLDAILTGAVRTYGADSIITDSAPGGAAYSTGYKGSDKGIAVGAWNVTIDAAKPWLAPAYVPLATLLEGAKLQGKATGIVATSNIQHATPADFSSHWHDRSNYTELAKQQVHLGIDVVLGGGLQYLRPKGVLGGTRDDGDDLTATLAARGYSLITTAAELAAATGPKVWGGFAADDMAYEYDRDDIAASQPSLSQMTAKAIALLSASSKGTDKGFFLFVEGSKVDWAAHANDPAGLVSDLLAFDAAVGVAMDFARMQGDTLVVAVADHGTGGVTIGVREDSKYSQTDDDFVVEPMRKVKTTGEGIDKILAGDSSAQKIKDVVSAAWSITDLTDAEVKAIADTIAAKKSLNSVVGPMLSKRARIGWTTGGHTGSDVYLYAYGPGAPAGLMENADVGRRVASLMGFDFPTLNARLFVEAGQAFGAAGYTVSIDKAKPAEAALVVTKDGRTARLPLSKNLLLVDGKVIELEGLVVLAEKLGKVYLPAQAVKLLQAEF